MIMREPAPGRLAAGAKLTLALLLLAALPAWTLAQGQAPAKEDEKSVELRKVAVAGGDVLYVADGDDVLVAGPEAKRVNDLDAKIAELTRQLEALKAARAAAGQKKASPSMILRSTTEDGKLRVWTVTGDGKPAEVKDAKAAPPVLLHAVTEGGKVRVWTVSPDGKLLESKDVKAPPAGAVLAAPPVQGRALMQPPSPTYRVIGSDGKEIKGARVIVLDQQTGTVEKNVPVEMKVFTGVTTARPDVQVPVRVEKVLTPSVQAGQVKTIYENVVTPRTAEVQRIYTTVVAAPPGQAITLSRATYALPKDRAAALAEFLEKNVKASVLELKIVEQGLTVTTTPELQTAIASIARLMAQGQDARFRVKLIQSEEKK